MMRKLTLPLLFCFGILIFGSCQKEDTVSLSEMESGLDFYPLTIGHYVVYDVDSSIWNDTLAEAATTHCQLRYNVADTFRNEEGALSYTINVLYRKTPADAYVPSDVIHVTPQDNQLIVQQHHQTFIKLVFPVSEGRSWDGNTLMPVKDKTNDEYTTYPWNYTYSNLDESFNAGIKIFPHTVTVNEIDDQHNDPDTDPAKSAYKSYAQEVYAYGVGLVYKERIFWIYTPNPQAEGEEEVSGHKKGYSVVMKVVDHS